jgi:hypothetical protein
MKFLTIILLLTSFLVQAAPFISPSPLAPTKGTPLVVTLNKENLRTDTALQAAADSYFTTDTTKWKKVSIEMKSNVGEQSKTMVFDATQATPTAEFLLSTTSRDTWEVADTTIYDFDGGFIKLRTSKGQLTVADFNFDLAPAPPVVSYFTQDFTVDSNTLAYFSDGSGVWDMSNKLHFAHSYNDGMGWGPDRQLSFPTFNVEIPDLGMGEHLNGYVGAGGGAAVDLNVNGFEVELEVANIDLDGAMGADITVSIFNGDGSASDTLPAHIQINSNGTKTIAINPAMDLPNIMGSMNKNLGIIILQSIVNGASVGLDPDEGLNYDILSYTVKLI